jgi:hypothetical protein
MKLYKLMINKRKNICVGEHWNEGWKVWGRQNGIYCMAEGETEDFVKTEVISDFFVFSASP